MASTDQITFGEKIYESHSSLIFLGTLEGHDSQVVIKKLKNQFPSSHEIAQFKGEFNIIHSMNIEGVIRGISFVPDQSSFLFVMEKFNGKSIAGHLENGPLSIRDCLALSQKILIILSDVHTKNIIHKDINPSNILWNPDDDEVRLIDFGISSKVSEKNMSFKADNRLLGTLKYISPEQTGRMNKSLDQRSDLYSFGITLYQMITGRIPFDYNDPMELIHAHIARLPPPPHQRRNEIPVPLSDIIMKLLSKSPDDRYSGCMGLLADIEHCRETFSLNQAVEPFELGLYDQSDRFIVPEKLYGRSTEIDSLLSAFDSLEHENTVLAMVSGYSGIGKSALVNEVQKSLVKRKGTFISGKFDQLKRDIPYYSFIMAFRELINNIIKLSDDEIEQWKQIILEKVENQGRIIIDVIPELELITGPQPEVQPMSQKESNNRFNRVFLHFIQSFCTDGKPLVIFLDDLQWADTPSLDIIESIFSADAGLQDLMIIGAYRDNEVDLSHPLSIMLNDLAEKKTPVSNIVLKPLSIHDISEMTSDIFKCSRDDSMPFSAMCHKKTGGNPFFLKQFLQTLNEEGLLIYDSKTWKWRWPETEKQIAHLNISENVVDLMIGKLSRLPEQSKNILKTASIIGSRFDILIISKFLNLPAGQIVNDLWHAQDSEFIYCLDNRFNNLDKESYCILSYEITTQATFKFSHDRIQQAAYELIDPKDVPALHLSMGKLILENTEEAERAERVFEIVNHFNAGQHLLKSPEERHDLAKLNLTAAMKAKSSAAHDSCYNHLKSAMKNLPDSPWKKDYSLTYRVVIESCEAAHLVNDIENMSCFMDEVIKNSQDFYDTIPVYELKVQHCIMQNDLQGAIDNIMTLFKSMGYKIPMNPSRLMIARSLIQTKLALIGSTPEQLGRMPEMTDRKTRIFIRLCCWAGVALYRVNPNLMMYLILKTLREIAAGGNCNESAFIYSAYALLLCGYTGDIRNGLRFGELALQMLEKFSAKELDARTHIVVYTFVFNWEKQIRMLLKPLTEAYKNSLDVGNLEHAALLRFEYCYYKFCAGFNLQDIDKEMEISIQLAERYNNESARNLLSLYRQSINNLMVTTFNQPHLIRGEIYDEDIMLPVHKKDNDRSVLSSHHILKLYLAYMTGRTEDALEWSQACLTQIDASTGKFLVPFFNFYYALTLLKHMRSQKFLNPADKRNVLKILKKFKKWARYAPGNFNHYYHLIQAEYFHTMGDEGNAMSFYEKSIKLAIENKFTNDAALGCELAGNYYYKAGYNRTATTYIREAVFFYQSWGSMVKIRQIQKKYPKFLSSGLDLLNSTVSIGTTTTTTLQHKSLDVLSVIKSAQTISGEIKQAELIRKLMALLLENAGARKGFLFTMEEKKLVLDAMGFVRDARTHVEFRPDPAEYSYPKSLVNYVNRTGNEVILHRACEEGEFANDEYIAENQIKSALCVPILHKGILKAICYLENEVNFDVFTHDRIEVLGILSGQAVISMENASLYSSIEKKVEQRTHELKKANEMITVLNEQLHQDNIRMSSELDVAKKIQQMVLPPKADLDSIKILNIACEMKPANEVGGDYYDVMPYEDGLLIGIGDVTDHGLKSGILMLMIQTSIQTMMRMKDIDRSYSMEVLNSTFFANARRMNADLNATISLLYYKDGTFHVIGQHEDILVVRRNGGMEIISTEHLGFPIGLVDSIEDYLNEVTFEIAPGDGIVLFTDGIPEAENKNREMYGMERFTDSVKRNWHLSAEEIRDYIVQNCLDHIGDQEIFDDITIIVAKRP